MGSTYERYTSDAQAALDAAAAFKGKPTSGNALPSALGDTAPQTRVSFSGRSVPGHSFEYTEKTSVGNSSEYLTPGHVRLPDGTVVSNAYAKMLGHDDNHQQPPAQQNAPTQLQRDQLELEQRGRQAEETKANEGAIPDEVVAAHDHALTVVEENFSQEAREAMTAAAIETGSTDALASIPSEISAPIIAGYVAFASAAVSDYLPDARLMGEVLDPEHQAQARRAAIEGDASKLRAFGVEALRRFGDVEHTGHIAEALRSQGVEVFQHPGEKGYTLKLPNGRTMSLASAVKNGFVRL